jgi:hypothetical protein
MIKVNNSKQLTINKQHRIGSYDEQPLLFSLVHIILCYISVNLIVDNDWHKKQKVGLR